MRTNTNGPRPKIHYTDIIDPDRYRKAIGLLLDTMAELSAKKGA